MRIADRRHAVDGRDVVLWRGGPGPVHVEEAHAYVEAHPRPPARGRAGTAGRQRLAALRLLAAAPASRDELRAALRATGWLAAADLDNRLRELRELGTAGTVPQLVEHDGRVALTSPFPTLDRHGRQALSFARSLLVHTPDSMASTAVATLDGLVPTLARDPAPESTPAVSLARQRLDAARADGRAVRVRFWSLNSGMERTAVVLPVRYATGGSAVKALCVPVDVRGHRTGGDIQLALDRLREVEPVDGWPGAEPDATRLQRCPIRLLVTRELHDVMRDRNLFDVQGRVVHEVEHDVLAVEGDFPVALAWDVMEQLCAWAGVCQPHEPLWLVHAVVERLRAGLAVMETAEPFRTVKPDHTRRFDSLDAALRADEEPPSGGARRLRPRPAVD